MSLKSKVCTSCKEDTPLDLMGRDRGSKDGFNIYCKECLRKRSTSWRMKNQEKIKASNKSYAQKNKYKKTFNNLKRYYEKKEEILIKNSKYRKENHQKRLEIERRSRSKNKNKIRASKRISQAKRMKIISECKKFYITEKELNRLYSDPCYNCGSKKNQSIDHIIPISRNGYHGIGNLMTLCKSCNASKSNKTITEWKIAKIKKGE